MANFDPFNKARAKRLVQTKTFTDPDDPTRTLTLSLRAQDNLDAHAAVDLQEEMIARYITGEAQEQGEPVPFPAVGGEPVNLSKTLCRSAANLTVMQCPEKLEDRKSFEFFVATAAVSETLWKEITSFAKDVDTCLVKND